MQAGRSSVGVSSSAAGRIAHLQRTLRSVQGVCSEKIIKEPTGQQLLDRYVKLLSAQADALATVVQAQNLAASSSEFDAGKYEQVAEDGRAALRSLGKVLGEQTPVFSRSVHGAKTWPTRTEVGPKGRRYLNSFKSSSILSPSEKRAYFQKKLEKFQSRGGDFVQDILLPQRESEFKNALRYDYCLLEDGTLRSASREANAADPGHLLLAEGGVEFKDTPVAMAGELMIVRDDSGEVAAAMVACNSGHFKPFAEDLPRMVPILERLGVPRAKIIFVGGPNNAAGLLPEIAQKFELPLPSVMPSFEHSHQHLKQAFELQASRKPWQRS